MTGAPFGVQRPHIPLLIGGHGKQVTYRIAAKYCDEINIDLSVADWKDGIAALHERCEEIGRDPKTLAVASGTHPAFPYKGLRVTGNQRMMTSEDLPSIMAFDLDSLGTRADEIAEWRDLGVDRLTCGAPGLAVTDDSLYELVEDVQKAGIPLTPRA